MAVNQFETMTEALENLKNRGFTNSFKIEEDGAKSIETGELIKPEDIIIVEYHRFEGDSNPDDMSVVYAVESAQGMKGTFVDAYGTYSNPHINGFLKKVKFKKGI
ncbi:MAG: phosphoribosylpyrophosphate synthetase [Ignavibacteria bacterium]